MCINKSIAWSCKYIHLQPKNSNDVCEQIQLGFFLATIFFSIYAVFTNTVIVVP